MNIGPWLYLLTTTIGCVTYGVFMDKSLEYTLAGPYWTAVTLLSIKYLGVRAP